MADAMEVLPWVFAAFFTGVFLTLFLQQSANQQPVYAPYGGSSLNVTRDELGRIVSIQGVA